MKVCAMCILQIWKLCGMRVEEFANIFGPYMDPKSINDLTNGLFSSFHEILNTMYAWKRVRMTSDHLFVTLYTLAIYPSVHKQLIRYHPNPFRGTHCSSQNGK